MAGKKEPIYGETRMLECPECITPTMHRWIGYYRKYSQWECVICRRVILAEPYKEE